MKLVPLTMALMLSTAGAQAVDVIKVPDRAVQPSNIPMGTQALESLQSSDRDDKPSNSVPARSSSDTPPIDGTSDKTKKGSARPPTGESR
jgi:hypothetical protein